MSAKATDSEKRITDDMDLNSNAGSSEISNNDNIDNSNDGLITRIKQEKYDDLKMNTNTFIHSSNTSNKPQALHPKFQNLRSSDQEMASTKMVNRVSSAKSFSKVQKDDTCTLLKNAQSDVLSNVSMPVAMSDSSPKLFNPVNFHKIKQEMIDQDKVGISHPKDSDIYKQTISDTLETGNNSYPELDETGNSTCNLDMLNKPKAAANMDNKSFIDASEPQNLKPTTHFSNRKRDNTIDSYHDFEDAKQRKTLIRNSSPYPSQSEENINPTTVTTGQRLVKTKSMNINYPNDINSDSTFKEVNFVDYNKRCGENVCSDQSHEGFVCAEQKNILEESKQHSLTYCSFVRNKEMTAPSQATKYVIGLPFNALMPVHVVEVSPDKFVKVHSSLIKQEEVHEDFKDIKESSLTDLCKDIITGTSTDEDILCTKRKELQKLNNALNVYLLMDDNSKLIGSSSERDSIGPSESHVFLNDKVPVVKRELETDSHISDNVIKYEIINKEDGKYGNTEMEESNNFELKTSEIALSSKNFARESILKRGITECLTLERNVDNYSRSVSEVDVTNVIKSTNESLYETNCTSLANTPLALQGIQTRDSQSANSSDDESYEFSDKASKYLSLNNNFGHRDVQECVQSTISKYILNKNRAFSCLEKGEFSSHQNALLNVNCVENASNITSEDISAPNCTEVDTVSPINLSEVTELFLNFSEDISPGELLSGCKTVRIPPEERLNFLISNGLIVPSSPSANQSDESNVDISTYTSHKYSLLVQHGDPKSNETDTHVSAGNHASVKSQENQSICFASPDSTNHFMPSVEDLQKVMSFVNLLTESSGSNMSTQNSKSVTDTATFNVPVQHVQENSDRNYDNFIIKQETSNAVHVSEMCDIDNAKPTFIYSQKKLLKCNYEEARQCTSSDGVAGKPISAKHGLDGPETDNEKVLTKRQKIDNDIYYQADDNVKQMTDQTKYNNAHPQACSESGESDFLIKAASFCQKLQSNRN